MHQLSNEQHEQVEKLAYRLWKDRGGLLGSPDDDWFRAERELILRSEWPLRLPFSSLMMGPVEY